MSDDENEEQNVIIREDDEPEALNYDSDEDYIELAPEAGDSDDDDIVGHLPLAEREQQQEEESDVNTPPPPPELLVAPPIQRQGVTVQLETDSESSTDTSDELTEPVAEPPSSESSTPDDSFIPQGFTAETFNASIIDDIEMLNISSLTQPLSNELETLYNSSEREEERKQSLKLLTDSINGTSKHTIFVNLNLCGADLFKLKLTQLSGFTFINCVFINAKIGKANMRKTAFYNCLAHKVVISDADLSEAYIYQCDFWSAIFVTSIMMDMFCMSDIIDYTREEDYPIIHKLNVEGFLDPLTPGNASNFMNKCRFEQAILNGSELSNIDFTESNFNNASLRQTTCIGTNFTKTSLKEADFTAANCLKANFTQAVGQQICFNNTHLQEATCTNVKFRHADFRRSTLSQADFTGAKIDKSIFSNCTAKAVTMDGSMMRECYFMNTNCNSLIIEDEDAGEGEREEKFASFKMAILTGSIIRNCKLKNAGFSEANCCDVKFIKCDFTEARFDDAYLHKVMFEVCNMEGVVLDRAFIDAELLLNLRITGVIPLEWPAPTDPIPDEALFCTVSDEMAPDFATLTDYDEGAPIVLPEPNTESSADSEEPPSAASAAGTHVSAAAYLADQFYWNPQLEANPTVTLQPAQQGEWEEEAEDVFTDAAGNRIRLPDEIDYNDAANITGNDEFPAVMRFMNFRERDFDGIDFSGKDLTGSSFFGCKLQEAKFIGCILKDTNFQWADLINTDFTNAQFEGDYSAGGLLEGATILFCKFDGATFNGEDRSVDYNEDTVVQPYDPKPYPSSADLVLPEGVPDVINSNAFGYNQKDDETTKIKDYVDAEEFNLVFRVVDVGGAYKDYLINYDYITSFLLNDKSTVYPCRKQFNIPGPSYPGPNQTTYHDIGRPIVNVGNMIGRRLFVLKDKFKDALDYNAQREEGETKKGFIFYKDANSETVPTFVSHPVLFNNESWVGNLHCNSGAEREALWYVKIADVLEGPEVAPPAAQALTPTSEGVGVGEAGVEGEYPLEYVDPYADDSDSEGSVAPPVEIVYNPPDPINFETVPIPPPAPLDVNTATGLNIRMNPENSTMTVINSPIKVSEPLAQATTSIIIAIQKEASNDFTNYIVKINDVIQLLKLNQKDVVPCKTNQPIELVNERRLVNIGALLGLIPLPRPIYIDKRQLIRLLPSGSAVNAAKRLRSFVMQYNGESELLPGIKEIFKACQGPIKIWDFQAWPNNIPVAPVAPIAPFEPGDEVTVSTNINNTLREGVIVEAPLLGESYYNGINGYMGHLANPLAATEEDIAGWQGIIGTSAYFVMLYSEEDEPPNTPFPILTDINNISRVEEGAVADEGPMAEGAIVYQGLARPGARTQFVYQDIIYNGQIVEPPNDGEDYYEYITNWIHNEVKTYNSAEDHQLGTTKVFVQIDGDNTVPVLTYTNELRFPPSVEAAPSARDLLPIGTRVNINYIDSDEEEGQYTGVISDLPIWNEDEPVYIFEGVNSYLTENTTELVEPPNADEFGIGSTTYFVLPDDDNYEGNTIPILVPIQDVTAIQAAEEQNYSPHSPAEAEQAGGGSKFKTLKHRHHHFRRHTLRRNADNDEAHVNKTRHHFKKYNHQSKRVKYKL